MSQVDLYLDAAERANTRRSYASAIQHFEVEWGGLLPATIDSIARYLAAYAESLSLNTLKHRLAALSRWHQRSWLSQPNQSPEDPATVERYPNAASCPGKTCQAAGA